MFFRSRQERVARNKARQVAKLEAGQYDDSRGYTDFVAYYVGDKVYRIWSDGEITQTGGYHAWLVYGLF